MRCKCRQCQTNLNTQDAYKTTINNKNAYFCDKNHYEKFVQEEANKKKKQEQESQARDKFYNLFCEILGVNGITNTALWKEKTEINKVFSDEVIISYLAENKDWIKTSVGRLSGGEFGKIRYVSVILRNKLGDYKPQVVVIETEKPKTVVDTTFYEPMQTHNNKRRSLADLEDDF
jgi:YHS domain-containing protein